MTELTQCDEMLSRKNNDVCSVYSTAEQFGHVVFKAFAVSRGVPFLSHPVYTCTLCG